jgi:hypothetical protein
MDRVLISSYVKGGLMPLGLQLTTAERSRLYKQLIQDYFAIDEAKPGILKSWLLGWNRSGRISAKLFWFRLQLGELLTKLR